MLRKTIIILAITCITGIARAQEFGLSFSYFLPKNGDFSTPISPFSFRGVGVSLNKFLALETGATLYRMSGLGMKGLPFESKQSLVGPNFTAFVPGELVIQFPAKNFEFDIKGGGFLFYGFYHKLNYGNLDRAIRTYEGWDVANSEFTFKNGLGYGFHGGIELNVNVTSQFGVSLEVNYLVGASTLPLTGSYKGGTMAGPNITRTVEYDDAKIDFTGLEISLGVFMRSGGKQPPRRKR